MFPPQIVSGTATLDGEPRPGTNVLVKLDFDAPYELPGEPGRVGLGSSVATYDGVIVEEAYGRLRARCSPGRSCPSGGGTTSTS